MKKFTQFRLWLAYKISPYPLQRIPYPHINPKDYENCETIKKIKDILPISVGVRIVDGWVLELFKNENQIPPMPESKLKGAK